MVRLFVALLCCALLTLPAAAAELAGVRLEPSVTVKGQVLRLNGSGIRKKFFFKVYVGSLYTTRHLASAPEALRDSGTKLIRMQFVYPRVEKEKIVEAFSEGIANNSPDVAGSPEARRFLSLFTADFHRGDLVDLLIGADGTVSASQNGRLLGSVSSPRLARAVLAIYLGDRPADESLKEGMLGRE